MDIDRPATKKTSDKMYVNLRPYLKKMKESAVFVEFVHRWRMD